MGIHSILSKILRLKPEAVTDALTQKGTRAWDSLRHMDLMTQIEKEFSVQFTNAELVDAVSVAEIRSLLVKKGVSPELL